MVLEQILAQVQVPLWIYDVDHTRVIWANPAGLRLWSAASLDELQARNLGADMSPAVARRLKQYRDDFVETGAEFTEQWTLYPKGVPQLCSVRISGIRDEDGRMLMLCQAQDLQQAAPEVTRGADALLHTQVMISLHLQDGKTLYLNPSARNTFARNQWDLSERFVNKDEAARLNSLIEQIGETSMVAEVFTTEGKRWHEITARACHDPVTGAPSILVSSSDVSEIKEAQQLAHQTAMRDSLTALPNRHGLEEIFNRVTNQCCPGSCRVAVFFIDLDEFKAINDTLGHSEGDQVLIEVASRLSTVCGPKDAVVRLGGDEFLILLPETPDSKPSEVFALEVLSLLANPLERNDSRLQVTPSIGIAVYPEHGENLDALMKCADIAMYEAKAAGRNRYCFFEESMRVRFEHEHELLADLKKAVAENQLVVHYQPRFCAETQQILAVEALVRWQHPRHGLLYPGAFIAICEHAGLIDEVGEWVLKQALVDTHQWRIQGADIVVSVNVSINQLGKPDFADKVEACLIETGYPAQHLELELTETAFIKSNTVVLENLEKICHFGVRTSVDDFGTGYSNFARLSELLIDCIKIDRSLIKDLPRNSELVEMVVQICQLMQATVVAEGIETAEVADWAKKMGCDQLQGFYFMKPVPADELARALF